MDEQVKKGLQGKIAMKRAEMNLESDEAALQQLIDNAKTGADRGARGSVEGAQRRSCDRSTRNTPPRCFPTRLSSSSS